jgi:hypothetical protein
MRALIEGLGPGNRLDQTGKARCPPQLQPQAGWGTVGLTLDVAFPPVVVAERYTDRESAPTAGGVLRGAPSHDDR